MGGNNSPIAVVSVHRGTSKLGLKKKKTASSRRRSNSNVKAEIYIIFLVVLVLCWWNYGIITHAGANSSLVFHRQRTFLNFQRTALIDAGLISGDDKRIDAVTSDGNSGMWDLVTGSIPHDLEKDSLIDALSQRDGGKHINNGPVHVEDSALLKEALLFGDQRRMDELAAAEQLEHARVTAAAAHATEKIKQQEAWHALQMGNMALDTYLDGLENRTTWWSRSYPTTGANGKSKVLFWGSELFHKWYSRSWSRAFQQAGFSVERRQAFGSLPKLGVEKLKDYAAAFCLTYEIGGCFSTRGMYRSLPPHIKLNMAPYLRETVWNKGNFCRIIRDATQDNPLFDDYIFKCFLHPENTASAHKYADQHPEQKFIIKPLASGGGRGIRVVDKLESIKSTKPLIIQNFLHNPHLIRRDGAKGAQFKWDIRAYAVITSMVPLRAYLYSKGLVRFAAEAFDPKAKNGGKPSTYLTNISLGTKWQKKNVSDITWSFARLKDHFAMEPEESGGLAAYDKLMTNIMGATSVVFLSAEQEWRKLYSQKSDSCEGCFKHIGLDIIIDENLNARVIEANGQPGMTLSKDHSDHYSQTKINMMGDLIKMVYSNTPVKDKLMDVLVGCDPSLLENLTETDWKYLLDYMAERDNTGGWLPVYPNPTLAKMQTTLLEQQKDLSPQRQALNKVLLFLDTKRN